MMNDINITIRNYRSIPYQNPISFDVGEGITFILGPNNVGKTNLLRFFYEFRHLRLSVANQDQSLHFHSTNQYFSNIKNQNSSEAIIRIQIAYLGEHCPINIGPINPGFLDLSGYFGRFVRHSPNFISVVSKLFEDSMYIGSFRTPTFQSSGSYYDIEIGHSFIKVWDEWAMGTSTFNRIKMRKLKDELKDLFEFNHFDIYPNKDNTNFIVETDDGNFTLDELGGGISHFILVLANAMIKNPSYIFIDEPETALHPKMQETFIRTLASKAKIGLVATSHSIGLARSVGADRIYSLSKDKAGKLTMAKFGDHYKPSITHAINELGYSQFVEIGGNNILLVEGVSDIKSFKEVLRKFEIDHHFIVMDLGGAGLISADRHDELSELKRLNAKSYNVIFDSEIGAEGEALKAKFAEFKKMCEGLGFNVFPTEYHSTDNYISQEVITGELGSNYKALGKYENLNTRAANLKWGKSLNWKMFREMKRSDFEGTMLEKFILEVLIPLTR